jgi:hypothetical protein
LLLVCSLSSCTNFENNIGNDSVYEEQLLGKTRVFEKAGSKPRHSFFGAVYEEICGRSIIAFHVCLDVARRWT